MKLPKIQALCIWLTATSTRKQSRNQRRIIDMAPKTLPPAVKQALILQWFHNTAVPYSLKELEKALPSVASINSMQVKEYIQALSDDGQIRVEKIGSGNWYWSFPSDAKKTKERVLGDLAHEENKLIASIKEIEIKIEEEKARRDDYEDDSVGEAILDRKALLELYTILLKETENLDAYLAAYSDNDPAEILRKEQQLKILKASAERWTDNVEAIESYMVKRSGDKAAIWAMMENVCGSEYVAGEGLKEL